jgi:uncharacterized membrane protein
LPPGAAAIFLVAAAGACAETVTDAQVLALAAKHCIACHARHPTHASFRAAPKQVTLETVTELKQHAGAIFEQTVASKAMPLGNQTGMTEAERAMLGQWIRALQ